MLVEFRVRNFMSFREEQVLSLVAANNNAEHLKDNLVSAGKLKLLKSAAIFGSNASGKSNLVKALDVMRDIILNSAIQGPGTQIPVTAHLLDDEYKTAPSEFEITFIHENVKYQYGFAATQNKIVEEWLFAFSEGSNRSQKWFTRSPENTGANAPFKFSQSLKGDKAILANKTRDNVLFLSVAAQWNHKQLTNVYTWFQEKLRIITADGLDPEMTGRVLLNDDNDRSLYKLTRQFLQNADIGIHGINVRETPNYEIVFPDNIPEAIRRTARKKLESRLEKEPPFEVEFTHVDRNGDEVAFPLESESDGTQKLFSLAIPWFLAYRFGYTIIFDELDKSLHPLLTRQLIEFIQNEHNTKSPQLIFTTHDSTLLDPDLLRRDQIWFTEKTVEGQTNLYPISDYKARKDEAFQKGYLEGRYGAIPILESFGITNG